MRGKIRNKRNAPSEISQSFKEHNSKLTKALKEFSDKCIEAASNGHRLTVKERDEIYKKYAKPKVDILNNNLKEQILKVVLAK